MKQFLLLFVIMSLSVSGAVFASDLSDYWENYNDSVDTNPEFWAIHKALQIDRIGDTNFFEVSLTDYIYDGTRLGRPTKGKYLDVVNGGYDNYRLSFLIGDATEERWPQNPYVYNIRCADNYGTGNLTDLINYYHVMEGPDGWGEFIYILGFSAPYNTPLFSFEYRGDKTEFLIYDLTEYNLASNWDYAPGWGKIPVPPLPNGPTAVPEPATLFGFGIPMLMIGISKFRKPG